MAELRGYLLGGFRLDAGSKRVADVKSRKARSLCAFLLINAGRTYSREVLVEKLWPDGYAGNALKALRQELWTIRSAFKQEGLAPELYFDINGESVGARPGCWLDCTAFETVVTPLVAHGAPALDDTAAEQLRRAITLYDGDLLPGLYDDWCLFPREALRDRFIVALERLMDWQVDQNDGAIGTAKRLLEADPLLEHVHRGLMRFYYAKGNRPAALRQ